MMFSNWLASVKRPSTLIVYWKFWPSGAGGAPIWPGATSWLCCLTTSITSWAVSPTEKSFCGSSQIRIEYWPTPKTFTLPTPGRRASSLTRLMVA